jgi:uncharacterized membrane protein YedE/YeeE
MPKNIYALLAGLIFGTGLIISGMINPLKVLAFLDVSGNWDPSLAVVMAAALITLCVFQRLPFQFHQPVRSPQEQLDGNQLKPEINYRLIIGAAIFGVGWGLAGICPGPALVNLSMASPDILWFVLAMFTGFTLFYYLHGKQN